MAGLPATPTLAQLLRRKIARDGPLAFPDFMALALYEPAHGYYACGTGAVGRAGDFFTSVSIGPVFGELLARRFLRHWQESGKPAHWRITECGAHDGKLAADLLGALFALDPAALDALEFTICEPLPALDAAQRDRLRDSPGNIRFVDSPSVLDPLPGIVFGNELLDALPFHLVSGTTADGVNSPSSWHRTSRSPGRRRKSRTHFCWNRLHGWEPGSLRDTAPKSGLASAISWPPSPARSPGIPDSCCGSTTALIAWTTTTRTAAVALCALSQSTARARIHSPTRERWTSPRMWISPALPKPPQPLADVLLLSRARGHGSPASPGNGCSPRKETLTRSASGSSKPSLTPATSAPRSKC